MIIYVIFVVYLHSEVLIKDGVNTTLNNHLPLNANIFMSILICFKAFFSLIFQRQKTFFEINIVVYELQDEKAKLIQRSRELYRETIQLNVFKNHLSLIVDFKKYCDVYQCQRCDKLWYGRNDFLRHTSSCDQTVTQSFPGGIF